ncbi:MAG TPA: phospholipase [Actinomycetota bacterium]|nr:phospholipase [Actinomycetota bacterium]
MSGLDSLTHLTRPARGEAEGALVLLHGRGADESDLYPLLDELDPDRRLLGLTARGPLSLPPGGAHWYVLGPVGFPNPATFLETYHRLGDWVDTLAAETGIPTGRTIIGGFSQGTAMTYAVGLGEDRPRPAGLVALSGFIPTVPGFSVDLSQPLPRVAIGHGSYDPVIPVSFGQAARDRLRAAGGDVTYRESPMAHSLDPAYLYELAGWVSAVIDEAAEVSK